MAGGLKVSEFNPAGPVQPTDILGIVRGNENLQTTADDFLAGIGSGFTSVATRAALATVNHNQHPYVVLTESGREGNFVWVNANLATLVAADTRQGIYVAPSSDLTGTSGAWVRRFSGFHNVRWFGAVGDDVTDDSAAFTGAIAFLRAVGQLGYGYSMGSPGLLVPQGKYFLAGTTLDITSTMILTGEGGAGAQGPVSLLRWSAGTTGIRLQAGNTTGASGTQADSGAGADGSIIRNLGLIGGRAGADGNFHAVHFRTVASLRDLYIERWEGDAMFATCTAGSGGATEGNANCLQVDRVYVENVRRALYLDGGDVNAGRFAGIVVKTTSQEGIFDSSFLGNTHLGHHVAGSIGAAYKSDGINARNVFVGCYSESDCAASDLVTPAIVVGGLHAAGFTAGTTAPILGNAGIAFDYFGSGAAQFGQTRVSFPTASGHVVAINNSAAMGGGLYSTLRFEQGIESGTTPASLGAIRIRSTTASPATNEAVMEFQTRNFAGGGALTTRVNLDGPNLSWRPETDNNMDSGLAAFRWKTFYGYTGNFTTSLIINGVTVIDNTSRLLAAAFPALTGDVTTAGGALVTTIGNNAVSYAKMQDVSAASRVVGRGSAAGAGDPQELTPTNGIEINGTNLQLISGIYNSYRGIFNCGGSHTAAQVAGTYALPFGEALVVSGTGSLYPVAIIYLDPADYPAVGALTAKLRVRAQLAVNDVAPTGNFTVGLYPVTRPATSGGAGVDIYTLGTVVAGSTVAQNTPAADSHNNMAGSDFAVPTAGFYCIGVVTTATVAASSHLHLSAQLQLRYT